MAALCRSMQASQLPLHGPGTTRRLLLCQHTLDKIQDKILNENKRAVTEPFLLWQKKKKKV